MKKCINPECSASYYAKGMCSKHYHSFRKYGHTKGNPKPMIAKNIESFIDKTAPNGCWNWLASKNQAGYGVVCVRGRKIVAHRHLWQIKNGPIPIGLLACHHCDNPSCVNPDHLFLGTYLDNSNDKFSKGRFKAMRGEENGASVLTEDKVREIRDIWADGKHRKATIARMFNISRTNLARIINMESWKHVI